MEIKRKKIGEIKEQINEFCGVMESNLKLLDEYNKRGQLIDKQYVYELTLCNEQENKNKIKDVFIYKYFNDEGEALAKFERTMYILFGFNKEQAKNLPDFFMKIPNIQAYTYFFDGDFINKENFEFDYVKNKVTVKPETLKKIDERYTIKLKSKNYEKVFDSIMLIKKESDRIKELYDDGGDNITNNVYRVLYYIVKNENVDLEDVYENLLYRVRE